MKVTPTSGPIASSITHQARDTSSSRHSLARRKEKALRERKEKILQARSARRVGERRQFVDRAFAADTSAAEQHEAIANPGRVGNLVNGQHEGAPLGRVVAERLRDVARLSQI